MKFTKQGADYVSGRLSIKKERGRWCSYREGSFLQGSRTLALAKAFCESVGDSVRPKAAHDPKLLELAAKSVEFDKAWGIPWHRWAELRVGCTLAELRAMEEKRDTASLIEKVDAAFDILECEDLEPAVLQPLFARLGRMVNTENLKEWIESIIDDCDIKIGSTAQFEKEIEEKDEKIDELLLETIGLQNTLEEMKTHETAR